MIARELAQHLRKSLLWTSSLLLVSSVAVAQQQTVRFDSGTISGLPTRNIGSAEMSGRVSSLTAYTDSGRLVVFAGAASGGVWKSLNGGSTFKPVFDDQPVQSIGAVAVDPSNPKIVWVGTGETWARNSVSIGDGIYKSTDGSSPASPGTPTMTATTAESTRPPTAARPGAKFSLAPTPPAVAPC